MWSEGTIGVPASVAGKPTAVHYWVKHYKNPSKYGINNGRISKVMLKIDGEIVCNYDRGWDIQPLKLRWRFYFMNMMGGMRNEEFC